MQNLALKACPQESTELREDPILRGFLECMENSQVRLYLRKNLGDVDMTLDKSLERALHIVAVIIMEEEDNKPRVSAIQSKQKFHLVSWTKDLVRILQTNQSDRQDNQKSLSQGARPKELLRGSERSSRETGDRNRNYNSYIRRSADNRPTNYDTRARSPIPACENRSRDRLHESCSKQSKSLLN